MQITEPLDPSYLRIASLSGVAGSRLREPALVLQPHQRIGKARSRMSVEARILSSSGRRQATVALMIATAMQAFDTTIANVALPQLEQSLGGGIELGSWVMTSYLCASAIMATLTGWLRRRYGARPLFIGSISLFIVASGLCSIAPSSVALIQFRLVQGTAAGIIQPLAQAILLDIYPQRDHGRMLAIWGATIMAGPILGPVLGGVIADLSSWRWIFVLNVPLGLIAILGLGQVPINDRADHQGPHRRRRPRAADHRRRVAAIGAPADDRPDLAAVRRDRGRSCCCRLRLGGYRNSQYPVAVYPFQVSGISQPQFFRGGVL